MYTKYASKARPAKARPCLLAFCHTVPQISRHLAFALHEATEIPQRKRRLDVVDRRLIRQIDSAEFLDFCQTVLKRVSLYPKLRCRVLPASVVIRQALERGQ